MFNLIGFKNNFFQCTGLIIFFLLQIQNAESADRFFYIVKDADIASKILSKSGLNPIYQRNGNLQELKNLNKEIRDLNKIFPGQKIYFSKKQFEKGSSLGLIGATVDHEIFFLKKKSDAILPKNENLDNPEKSDLSSLEFTQRTAHYFFGMLSGFNYLKFSQNGSEIFSLDYSTFGWPSFKIEGGVDWLNRHGIEFRWTHLPIEIGSNQLLLSGSKFTLSSFLLEGTYKLGSNQNADNLFRIRYGLQLVNLPFLKFNTSTSARTILHDLTLAAVGFDFTKKINSDWNSNFTLNTLYPISQSSDDIIFTHRILLEFSNQILYDITKNLSIGPRWTLQWHDFNYEISDKSINRYDKGDCKYIFSSLELGLNYTF